VGRGFILFIHDVGVVGSGVRGGMETNSSRRELVGMRFFEIPALSTMTVVSVYMFPANYTNF
jgi:hypothetical protein